MDCADEDAGDSSDAVDECVSSLLMLFCLLLFTGDDSPTDAVGGAANVGIKLEK